MMMRSPLPAITSWRQQLILDLALEILEVWPDLVTSFSKVSMSGSLALTRSRPAS